MNHVLTGRIMLDIFGQFGLQTAWIDTLRSFVISFYDNSVLLWAWIGGFFYVSLIILSMIHALLNKRNIRAAIGWIGLIWFAPVLGIVLYFLFGINRIRRRAKSRIGDRDHVSTPDPFHPIDTGEILKELPADKKYLGSLARLTHRLTELPLLEGNTVEPLFDGDEAYPAMLEAIREARESITLCSYIFAGSGIGKKFVDELVRAKERGVSIRVIVDDVGARHSSPSAIDELRNNDIPVRRFMETWLPWKFRYANLRNHRKIMVVDGSIGFTGGMNISKKYWQPDYKGTDTVHRDLHFRLEGPVVSHLQYTFAEDWVFCDGEELSGPSWFPEQNPQGTVLARGISHGPDEDYDKIHQTLIGATAVAEESIKIITPYFLPDEEIMESLKVAALRGIDLELFIPQDINLRLLEWASGPTLEELTRSDADVYRTPEPFDHSKLTIVDDCWVFLGSTNWDARSLKLNFEFNVECYDEELASLLLERIDSLRDESHKMELEEFENRTFVRTVRDNAVRLFSPYL